MKKFVVFIIFITYHFFIFSTDFSISIGSNLGFSCNKINEFVYDNDKKVSQLVWKNAAPSLGIRVDCSFKKFVINLEVKTSIPVSLGNIVDYDFLSDTESISMFSYHDIITDKNYSFEINLFYNFLFSDFSLGVGLACGYSNIKMEANNGYLQYPSGNEVWTGSEPKSYLNGPAMSYEQSRSFAGVLLFLKKNWKSSNFSVMGMYYPFILVECIDNHFLRAMQFMDHLIGKYSVRIKPQLMWKIRKQYYAVINIDFFYLRAEGNTSVNSIGIIMHNTTELDKTCRAATNYYNLDFTLGFMTRI